jgi:Zn-dependent peptidase ImmA (M78 family)
VIPPVPRRSQEELRTQAELFLDQHHPSGEVPVPIEEIVEFELGLEIRPIRDLRKRFGFEGSLSSDLTTILVDEELETRFISRYRFTLAHEVGHLVLHAEQVQAIASETTSEWKATVQSIPALDYSRMEFQAYEFAGCLLVPRQPLLALYEEAGRLAEEHGIDLAELQDTSIDYIAGWIARNLDVSTAVVERRLKREGILT